MPYWEQRDCATLGFIFPNTDESFKDADSKDLLRQVMDLIAGKGYKVENLDATLVSEQPKIAPRINEIKSTIAGLCNIEADAVGVKATTSEKVGFYWTRRGH